MPPPRKADLVRNRWGFTLAETLITLGIIGVVAALTLPTLIDNYKAKVLEAQFKKGYSTLSQAIMQMYYTTGVEIIPENFGQYALSEHLKNYYHIIKDCGMVNVNTKGCIQLSKNEDGDWYMDLYKSYTGGSIYFGYIDDGVLITNEGIVLLFEQGTQAKNTGRYLVGIDINGFKKGPNRFGHDVFVFEVEPSGNLIPLGNEKAKWWGKGSPCNNSNSDMNGYGCSNKALSDPNYFKNLPK